MNNQWMGVTVQSQGTPEGKAVVSTEGERGGGENTVVGSLQR